MAGIAGLMAAYSLESVIGSGGYGTVYSATRRSDGLTVAIKAIDKNKANFCYKQDDCRVLPLEFCLLEAVSHVDGVNHLLDYYELDDVFALVLERPPRCQDLFDYITTHGALRESATCRQWFAEIVDTVVGVQRAGVVHRDIKDENFVVDLDAHRLQLIDFGAGSFAKSSVYTDYNGTLVYCCPEWLQLGYYHAEPATVWSLGCLLYDMVVGDVPFHNRQEIIRAEPTFSDRVSPECRDLIRRCLSYKPADRPTLGDILQHPWLNSSRAVH